MVIELGQTFIGHLKALDELFPSALSRIDDETTRKSYDRLLRAPY